MSDLLGAQEQINQLLKQIDPYRFSADQFDIPRNQNLQQMMNYLRGFNERNDERQDQLRWLNFALRGKEHYRDNPNNPEEQAFANDFANTARGQLPESLQRLVSAETPYARAVANVDIFKNGYPQDPLRAMEEYKEAWGNANYLQGKKTDPAEIQRLEQDKQIAHAKANLIRAYSAKQGNPISSDMTLGDVRRAIQDRDNQRKVETAEWLQRNNLDPQFGVYDPTRSRLLGRQSLGTEPGKDMVNTYFEMGQKKAEQVYLADQRARDTARRIIEQKNRYESAQQGYNQAVEALQNPNLTAEQRAEAEAMRDNSMIIMQDANAKAEMTRRIAKENGINLTGFTANDTIKQSEENLMNESLKAIDEVYHGKFGKSSDQFFEERYQYYKQQGMDEDTAIRLAGEEGTMYKYMKIQYMRDVTPEVINGGRIENSQQLAWIAKLAEEDPMFAQMLLNGNVSPDELYKRADDRRNALEDQASERAYNMFMNDDKFKNSLSLLMQNFYNQLNRDAVQQDYKQSNLATVHEYNTDRDILLHNLGLEKIKYQGETDARLEKYKTDLKDRYADRDLNRSIKLEKVKAAAQIINQKDLKDYERYLKDEDFKLAWERFSATVTTDFMEKHDLKTADDVFNWFFREWNKFSDTDKKAAVNAIRATRTDADDKVLNQIESYAKDLQTAIGNANDTQARDIYENLIEYLDSDKWRESNPETKQESLDMIQESILAAYKAEIISEEEAAYLLYAIEEKQQESGSNWEPPPARDIPQGPFSSKNPPNTNTPAPKRNSPTTPEQEKQIDSLLRIAGFTRDAIDPNRDKTFEEILETVRQY